MFCILKSIRSQGGAPWTPCTVSHTHRSASRSYQASLSLGNIVLQTSSKSILTENKPRPACGPQCRLCSCTAHVSRQHWAAGHLAACCQKQLCSKLPFANRQCPKPSSLRTLEAMPKGSLLPRVQHETTQIPRLAAFAAILAGQRRRELT